MNEEVCVHAKVINGINFSVDKVEYEALPKVASINTTRIQVRKNCAQNCKSSVNGITSFIFLKWLTIKCYLYNFLKQFTFFLRSRLSLDYLVHKEIGISKMKDHKLMVYTCLRMWLLLIDLRGFYEYGCSLIYYARLLPVRS